MSGIWHPERSSNRTIRHDMHAITYYAEGGEARVVEAQRIGAQQSVPVDFRAPCRGGRARVRTGVARSSWHHGARERRGRQVSRQTPYARRARDRRRKRDRAWRETVAWLAVHPGPSSAEVFAEYGRLRREQVEIRAAMYRRPES